MQRRTAIPLVITTSTNMVKTTTKNSNTDILVAIGVLQTKVDILSEDIREMKDGTKIDIQFLKDDKVSRAEMVHINTEQVTINLDVETRIRFIERYMWLAIGALGIVEFGLNFYSNFK